MTRFFRRLWFFLSRPIWESEFDRREREWIDDCNANAAKIQEEMLEWFRRTR